MLIAVVVLVLLAWALVWVGSGEPKSPHDVSRRKP